jgi:hypothetical protein
LAKKIISCQKQEKKGKNACRKEKHPPADAWRTGGRNTLNETGDFYLYRG